MADNLYGRFSREREHRHQLVTHGDEGRTVGLSDLRKMRAARLPEAYAQALETGLWPDTAILPEAEARATGQALRPLSVAWHMPSVVFP